MTRFGCLLLVSLLLLGGCSQPTEDLPGQLPSSPLENGEFWADLNGVEIHFEVHGTGPVLMTVPNSWGLSLEGLRGMFRPLEKNVTMVYFDPRGIGQSGYVREDSDMGMAAVRADFLALREHLELDRVHAIGWSNGAGNLLYLAAESPEVLDKIIVLHGVPYFGPEQMQAMMERHPKLIQDFGALQQELAQETVPLSDKTLRMKAFWLENYFPTMTAKPQTSLPLIQSAFREAKFSWSHAKYAEREAQSYDAREKLSQIRAPSLVISGAYDMTPLAMGQEMAAGIPKARFVPFRNSGHFAPLEEPAHFERVVHEFLGSGSDAAGP